MIEIRHKCKIQKGKLILDDKESFQNYVMNKKEGNYTITIESVRLFRTKEASKYFHIVCRLIGQEWGHGLQYTKEKLKEMFAYDLIEDEETGKITKLLKHTEDMTMYELYQLTQDAIEWAYDKWDLVIPEAEHIKTKME